MSKCPECGINELVTNEDLFSGLCKECREEIIEENFNEDLKKDAEELENSKHFEIEPFSGREYEV